MNFQELLKQGIPKELPPFKNRVESDNHAPNRNNVLNDA